MKRAGSDMHARSIFKQVWSIHDHYREITPRTLTLKRNAYTGTIPGVLKARAAKSWWDNTKYSVLQEHKEWMPCRSNSHETRSSLGLRKHKGICAKTLKSIGRVSSKLSPGASRIKRLLIRYQHLLRNRFKLWADTTLISNYMQQSKVETNQTGKGQRTERQ